MLAAEFVLVEYFVISLSLKQVMLVDALFSLIFVSDRYRTVNELMDEALMSPYVLFASRLGSGLIGSALERQPPSFCLLSLN